MNTSIMICHLVITVLSLVFVPVGVITWIWFGDYRLILTVVAAIFFVGSFVGCLKDHE